MESTKMTIQRRLFTATILAAALAGITAPAKAEVYELGWPYPPNNLEAYAARNQYPPLCNPTNKPGPDRLRVLLGFWFGAPNQYNPNWHIGRPCNVSATSYHREGRALDFYVNASEPRAQAIIDWILATDEYGNPHSKARRLGIIEIIWKDSIWSSDQPGGFRPCPSCGPHYDHIHFSFSREGANAQTSWFTTNDNVSRAACASGTAEVKYWTYPSGFGPLRHVRRIAYAGSTYATQSSLAGSPWRVYSSLGPTVVAANAPVSALYGARAYLGPCTVTLF
jgi:hypothetical protein